MKLEQIIILIFIGVFAGFVGGMAGVGGGLVIVPLLMVLLGMTQHQAQGTSIGTLLFPIGALAVVNYYKAGHINWGYVAFLAAAFVVGSYFGSKVAIAVNEKLLKRIFATILIVGAVKMYYDSFR